MDNTLKHESLRGIEGIEESRGMLNHATTMHRSDGEAYLEQLNFMRAELSAAMVAISGNSLQALEESLWKQEVLCVGLNRLLQTLGRTPVDDAVRSSILSATADLQTLNRTYHFLVQQSHSSTDLLYSLCRTYKDTMPLAGEHSPQKLCSLKV